MKEQFPSKGISARAITKNMKWLAVHPKYKNIPEQRRMLMALRYARALQHAKAKEKKKPADGAQGDPATEVSGPAPHETKSASCKCWMCS